MALSRADQQARRNAAVVELAAGKLGALWPRVDWASAYAVQAVTTVFRAITTRYGQASAAVAAEFYDDVRDEHRLPSRFRAIPADPVPDEQISQVVESAFRGGLIITELDEPPSATTTTSDLPVEQRVPRRLDQALSRLVLQPARDTIADNTANDPAKPTWIRVPTGPTTCEFCIMLASRELGPNFSGYSSREAALFDEHGQSYHRNCDCVAVPVFPGDDPHQLSPNMSDYQDIYNRATEAAGTHRDAEKILAEMRQLLKEQTPTQTNPEPVTARPVDLDAPRHAESAGGGGGRKPPTPPGHNGPVSGDDERPGDRLDRLFRQQTESATDEQRRSVAAWQRKDDRFYQQIQQAVAGGDLESDEAADVAIDLQDLAIPLTEDIEVWRGIRDVTAAFDVEPDRLWTRVGRPLEQQRFVATSLDRDVAVSEFTQPGRNPVLLKVTVKAGTRAVWIPPLGDNENAYQQELLIAPGAILRILEQEFKAESNLRDLKVPVIAVEVSDE